MEEPIIELHMEYNEQARKAFREAFVRRRIPFYALTVVLAAEVLSNVFHMLVFWSFLNWPDRLISLVPLAIVALLICMPFIQMHSAESRTKKLYGGTIPTSHVTFGDSILLNSGNDRVEFRYEWIKKTKRYRYSYVIVMQGGRALRVVYDSFTKGDLESLKTLLREKCPGVKIVD